MQRYDQVAKRDQRRDRLQRQPEKKALIGHELAWGYVGYAKYQDEDRYAQRDGEDRGNDGATADITEDRIDSSSEAFVSFKRIEAVTKSRCDDADGEQRIDEIQKQQVRSGPVEKKTPIIGMALRTTTLTMADGGTNTETIQNVTIPWGVRNIAASRAYWA